MTTAPRPRRATVQRSHPTAADLVAVDDRLAGIASAQYGVATRAQLRTTGLSRWQIDVAVDALRWRAYGKHVIVLDNAPLSAAQRLWVAVLLPGKTCGLAGPSAAANAGLRGFEPERVHVVVRHATHVLAPSWIKLHESRRFTTADLVPVHGLPSTNTARSVVDAAAWSARPRRACAFLCAAVQQRITTTDRLREELASAGAVRHAAIMRDILGDIAGGGHTLAEIDLGALATRAGLTIKGRQRLRRDPKGRNRWLDAEIVLPDGTILVVEVDGMGHLDPETWTDDLSRQNEVAIGKSPVLRFASLTVRLEPDAVVDQLARIRAAYSR